MAGVLPYLLPAIGNSSSSLLLNPRLQRPSTAPNSASTSRSALVLPEMDILEQHLCYFTPFNVLVAAQPVSGTSNVSTGLYLGPVHPRNTVLHSDLWHTASLPDGAKHQGAHLPMPGAARHLQVIDFQALASLQGLLEAIRFVRSKYTHSTVCVHLRTDYDIAVKAWNEWIPQWEGTSTQSGAALPSSDTALGRSSGDGSSSISSSSARGWPALPGRGDDSPRAAHEASLSSSARGLVGSSPSTDNLTMGTGSMFTALSSAYSLQANDSTLSLPLTPRKAPVDFEMRAPYLRPSASHAQLSPPPGKRTAAHLHGEKADMAVAPPPIPMELSATTYAAAYPLLRALAVLHRLFAHDNEEAFTEEQKWNGRMRLTVSQLPLGRINAATELIEAAEAARSASATSEAAPEAGGRRGSSSSEAQTFPITTVSWKRALTEAEKQEEAERQRALIERKLAIRKEIEEKQLQQQQQQLQQQQEQQQQAASRPTRPGRLQAFFKRRPSAHAQDTVDAVFGRSQFADEGYNGTAATAAAEKAVKSKLKVHRRSSISSIDIFAKAQAEQEQHHPAQASFAAPSAPPMTPPPTNHSSPSAAVALESIDQRTPRKISVPATTAQITPPVSDPETSHQRQLRPPSPGNALSGAVKRKPVPVLVASPIGSTPTPTGDADPRRFREPDAQAEPVPDLRRQPSALGLELDLPGERISWYSAEFGRSSLQHEPAPAAADHRPTISENVDNFLERGTQPRKRASSVTVTNVPSQRSSSQSAFEGAQPELRNIFAFPKVEEAEPAQAAEQAPEPERVVETVPKWRWANPRIGADGKLLPSTGHIDLDTKTPPVWPAWKWAGQPPHSYAGMQGPRSQAFAFGQDAFSTPPPPVYKSQPTSRNSPVHTRSPSASRAASPAALQFLLDVQRHDTPSPLGRTRASSLTSGGSTGICLATTGHSVAAVSSAGHQAPPSTSSSGRTGLAGQWKWSNESQSRLERQKARAEEMAGSAAAAASLTGGLINSTLSSGLMATGSSTKLAAGPESISEYLHSCSGGVFNNGGGGGSAQQSITGSRRSSASGIVLGSSSHYSSSPYGSFGGPGTLTAFTLSAPGSSAAPSPGKSAALTLHDGFGPPTGVKRVGSAQQLVARRQRSIPVLSQVADADQSSTIDANPSRRSGTTERAAPTLAQSVTAPMAITLPPLVTTATTNANRTNSAAHITAMMPRQLVDECGSPISETDLALSAERQRATAAWTASIAPLVQQPHSPSRVATSSSGSAPPTPSAFGPPSPALPSPRRERDQFAPSSTSPAAAVAHEYFMAQSPKLQQSPSSRVHYQNTTPPQPAFATHQTRYTPPPTMPSAPAFPSYPLSGRAGISRAAGGGIGIFSSESIPQREAGFGLGLGTGALPPPMMPSFSTSTHQTSSAAFAGVGGAHAGAHASGSTQSPQRVARHGTRSRILSSLKEPIAIATPYQVTAASRLQLRQ